MKKIFPIIGLIALLIMIEISWSGFLSVEGRPYFFLFSSLALSVLKRGFLPSLASNIVALIVFEGVIRSSVGSVSLYGILFAYGMSFLLKRMHLEYGGEKIFLALAAGIGMALYLPFDFWYEHSFHEIVPADLFGWIFAQNILIGAVVFLIMLRVSSRFREEQIPFSDSFLKT